MRFSRAALFFIFLISVSPLFSQDVPASAATAVGYEGLQYNPAAVAVQRTLAAGLGTILNGSDEYSLSATLSDSLRLEYRKEGAGEKLNFLYGLAFPRDSSFHVGIRVGADLLDFRRQDIDLATGLLWYPHRYLAVAAGTTVVASPYTIVPLVGVGARFLFYRNLFEKLGIDIEYARSSDYKSALDRFLRESLSEENRRQLEEYLASSYELILDILVSSRGLSRQRARELVDGGPYWCDEAAELGLVDEVIYYQDFEEQYLEELSAGRLAYREHQGRSWRRPEIAVLKASGAIVNSRALGPWHWLSSRSYITEKNLIPVLKHLQDDAQVSAVVLCIDSGGGDGLVSDKIWKGIMELKGEKPVVVVVGRVAASGGYYLAMAGDKIFARKTALTGSIGSFSFKIVIAELLERYGITTDSVQFGENVDLFSPFVALSEEQRQRLQDLNDSFTDQFYRKVAEARSLPYETVEEIGGGRIYSGERALELELIDEIGGVYSALKYLEEELQLSEEEYRLRYYPDWNMLFLMALQELRKDRVRLSRDYSGLARLLFP